MKSFKQRKLEKEQRKQEEKKKQSNALSILIAIVFALFGIVVFPSMGAVIFLLAAAAVLPFAPIRKLWKRIPIKGGWFKPVALFIAFIVACCFSPTPEAEESDSQTAYTEVVEDISPDEEAEDVTVIAAVPDTPKDDAASPVEDDASPTEDEKTADPVQTETKNEEKTEPDVPDVEPFDVSAVPAYSGKAYTAVNDNVPFFTEADLQKAAGSYESYSGLDSLGRCGMCIASVGKDIMPTEERGNIGQVKPTGWQTVKYNGIVDGNYLYNRCHLIGYQLTGENANEKNLITGTRYMNVDGMLPFENMVADYVKSTGNHVLYRVTPIFEGDNLVASGVTIEAESVEDNGAGLLFNVYVYNVQPGISIDYASGKSEPDGTVSVAAEEKITPAEEAPAPEQTHEAAPAVEPEPQPPADTPANSNAYAVNSKNGKIHITGACPATGNGSNAMTAPVYFGTYEEAEAYSIQIKPSQDKRKCGNCW